MLLLKLICGREGGVQVNVSVTVCVYVRVCVFFLIYFLAHCNLGSERVVKHVVEE